MEQSLKIQTIFMQTLTNMGQLPMLVQQRATTMVSPLTTSSGNNSENKRIQNNQTGDDTLQQQTPLKIELF